jgi:AraC family transcriptional regulator
LTPEIVTHPAIQILGMRAQMSYAMYNATAVWQRFMPRRKEIKNSIGNDLYSIQVFGANYWKQFDPTVSFDKWVGVAVLNTDVIPLDMETLLIPAGLFVVFTFVGDETKAPAFFEQIYAHWLPNSIYDLDDRPHFEILGEKYKRFDPTSEETVWIPVKLKK